MRQSTLQKEDEMVAKLATEKDKLAKRVKELEKSQKGDTQLAFIRQSTLQKEDEVVAKLATDKDRLEKTVQ